MAFRTLSSSRYKAQFFVLSAFAIVSVLFLISRWIEPRTIIDTSQILLSEEIFIFNNIVEKANETIYLSDSAEELKYNLEEYKILVEDYGRKKNLRIIFNISEVDWNNPTTSPIYISLSSPGMSLNRTLYINRYF